MKTGFKSSFAKDLKSIKSKTVLEAVARLIEVVEVAQNLRAIPDVKKLKRREVTIELGLVTIALESPSTKTRSHSFDAWIGKRFTVFPITGKPPNKALQTDNRRALVTVDRNVTLAPLAAERQSR